MRTIRILVPIHIHPARKSATTIFFENLLPVLKKRLQVHMIWFIYQPERLDLTTNSPDSTILDIHDFKDAVDVLKKVKPDLIYASATWDLMDYAFSSAGKYLKIPILSEFYTPKPIPRSQTDLIKLYMTRFFEDRIPTDTEDKKQFMRRGRFFIYKYLFLLKTLLSTKTCILKVIENFFMILKLNLTDYKPNFDSRFANTMHWLESEKLIDPLVSTGFNKSTLVVTGSPMYDQAFQKIQSWKPTIKKNGKLKILLITTSLFEHGFWTKMQRDTAITEIVRNISNQKDELTLSIKIHPSSEILSEYQSLINQINPSIPIYQKGDILDFLKSADVVLSFASGGASAMTYALIAKKPIIICNFYNLDDDLFLKRGLALECKKPSEIIQSIYDVVSSNPVTTQKVDEFVKEFLYKSDGKAAERISDIIAQLVETNKVI